MDNMFAAAHEEAMKSQERMIFESILHSSPALLIELLAGHFPSTFFPSGSRYKLPSILISSIRSDTRSQILRCGLPSDIGKSVEMAYLLIASFPKRKWNDCKY